MNDQLHRVIVIRRGGAYCEGARREIRPCTATCARNGNSGRGRFRAGRSRQTRRAS